MTKQESIKNMLNKINQKVYHLHMGKFAYSMDAQKINTTLLQHTLKYEINGVEINTEYLQDSICNATITSSCTVDDQLYKMGMVQSCKVLDFTTTIEEKPVEKETETMLSTPIKRPNFPKSLSAFTSSELETIVKELQECKDVDAYFEIKVKHNIHLAALKKILRLYNLPSIPQLAATQNPLIIRSRKALSEDDELNIVQLFISTLATGCTSKEAIAKISKEKKIHADILKDIYSENKNFISKKIPLVSSYQNEYQNMKPKQVVKATQAEPTNQAVIDNAALEALRDHFNG